MKLLDIAADPDPLPRSAPVGPGSAYAAVAAAVAVAPERVELWSGAVDGRRDVRELRTWEFAAGREGDPEDQLPAGSWRTVAVPHLWSRSEPELCDHKGPAWYRRSVPRADGRRQQLWFAALDYVSAVWCDGVLLGRHEGGFTPVAFDLPAGAGPAQVVTRLDDPVEPSLLAPSPVAAAKRKVKGVFEFHDSRPGGALQGLWWDQVYARRWGTGGVADRALLVRTGDVRIDAVFVTATADRLAVNWVLTNHRPEPVRVELRTTVGDDEDGTPGLAVTSVLPPGASRVAVQARVENVRLWEPVTGPGHTAALYPLATEVRVDGAVSDARSVRFGAREVEMSVAGPERYRLHLNGTRHFVRAANYIPGVWWPEMPEALFRRDVELAVTANLNSFGPHAHVLPDRFYDVTDAAGLLVYQDFPLNLGHDANGGPLFDGGPGYADATVLLAAEFTYHLFNRPSVVYYCGHNEPAYQLAEAFSGATHPDVLAMRDRFLAVPDEEAIDDRRAELWREIDPTRPAYKASGLGRRRDEGDTHGYSGSLTYDAMTNAAGMVSHFVSEYGAWSADFSAAPLSPAAGDWPTGTEMAGPWEEQTHFYHSHAMRAGRPDRYPDFATWTFGGQIAAAMFVKVATEGFRARAWDPCGGARYHLFVDHWGGAGGGVVDRHRTPQLPYWSLAAANRPLLPVADVPPSMRVAPGEPVSLATHVVDDRPGSAGVARLEWRLARLAPDEALVLGVDDPQVPQPFGKPVPPEGDLAVVPLGPGTEVSSGSAEVVLTAGGSAAGPVLALGPFDDRVPTPYVLVLRVVSGGDVVENWSAFVVAPPGWSAPPGPTPVPGFALTLTGSGPFRLLRRWTGETVAAGEAAGGSAGHQLSALSPDQYLLEVGGREVPVALYGDVTVDLATGKATPASTFPWEFDPTS